MKATMPYPQLVEMRTADGMTLRARRYTQPGTRAVLCAHGLASSGYEFDLPLWGFRVSETLYNLGYEVWVLNFRGAGHVPWRSEAGDWRHSGDELGALDLPAAIERVVEETGSPPYYLGHSFGGMALYMYLGGGVIEEGARPRVRLDAEEAAKRNRLIAGAVTAGSPVSLDPSHVDLVERIRRHPWTQKYLLGLERFLLRRAGRTPCVPIGAFSLKFGFRHPFITRLLMSNPLVSMYMIPRNMGPEACRLFGTWAGGDVSIRQVAQTVRTIRSGKLTSMGPGDEEPFRYANGLPNITVPLVALAGGRDMMRPTDVRYGVLDRISSVRKEMVVLPSCGHVDLLYYIPYGRVFEFLEGGRREVGPPS